MEEKKPNLLISPGPPRTGTTYLYEFLCNHPNKEYRNTIQPPKGWIFQDHQRELYIQNRISIDKYYITKMQIKENRISRPNIIELLERCLHVTQMEKDGVDTEPAHKRCHQLMTAWTKTFPKEADWHLALTPHIANPMHLFYYSKTYRELLENGYLMENIITGQQRCDIITEMVDVAKELYFTFLNGLANSGLYNRIDFVIGLRNPQDLFLSNLKNVEFISKGVKTILSMEQLDVSPIDFLKKLLTVCTKEELNKIAPPQKINEVLLYHLSIIRIYEQFMDVKEQFKDHPNVNVKYFNFNTLNNKDKLLETFPCITEEAISQSTIFGKKINSTVEGFVPKENFNEYYHTNEDWTNNSDVIYKQDDLDFDFVQAFLGNSPIDKRHKFDNKDMDCDCGVVVDFMPCCSFNVSERFVSRQNIILDK